jgi:hypothetical protein
MTYQQMFFQHHTGLPTCRLLVVTIQVWCVACDFFRSGDDAVHVFEACKPSFFSEN